TNGNARSCIALPDARPGPLAEVDPRAVEREDGIGAREMLGGLRDDLALAFVGDGRPPLGSLVHRRKRVAELAERLAASLHDPQHAQSRDERVVEGEVVLPAEEVPGLLAAEQ